MDFATETQLIEMALISNILVHHFMDWISGVIEKEVKT